MKTIHFYFDFISPYAWLGFDALPQALQGISHRVVHKPVLFAAMLKHHGQLGPAEMPSKRDWTYRQVLWLARQQGTALQLPAMHPFNPLGLLRLAIACGAQGQPSRYVCEKNIPSCLVRGPGRRRRRASSRAGRQLEPRARRERAQREAGLAGAQRRSHRIGRVWGAHLGGGWPTVLGARRFAHVARLFAGRCLV